MKTRVKTSAKQRERLLAANAHRCCVCKREGIGLHFHHIDGDKSNTVDANLAVLCVEDHDKHHRPSAYGPRHLELDAREIQAHKSRWERFVHACRTPGSGVLATVTAYGSEESIHSAQVVYQWADESIEYARTFHLLDGTLDQWTDQIVEETRAIGPCLDIALVDGPQPVDHCPCCGNGLSRTANRGIVMMMTDPRWRMESVMSIYINPDRASLAVTVGLGDEVVFTGWLHLCGSKHLHFRCDEYEEGIPIGRN